MNQRRSPRARTLLHGRVVFNNRFSLVECRVRDLSSTGAQIDFSHPITLPQEVILEIPTKGVSSRARVMWSDGTNHGLMFLDQAQEEARDSVPVVLAERNVAASQVPRDPVANASAQQIKEVLDEARDTIARIAGVPAANVRLTLEIGY